MFKTKSHKISLVIIAITMIFTFFITAYNIPVEAKNVDCSTCNGTGKIRCTNCNGTGFVYIPGPTLGTSIQVGCSKCSGHGTLQCTTCSGVGHINDGTTDNTTTSKPKATKLTSAKKKNKTTATLKWKKVSSITGYQIQYSTSSKFKNSTKVTVKKSKTSTNIKKLKKGKKYYFRIRTYKTVDGTKTYSSWSSKKSVKL